MFTVHATDLALGVVSETHELRAAVLASDRVRVSDDHAETGLLLGRPAQDHELGTAAWVLYESGDIVLRRSRDVADTISAARFHLGMVAAAVASPLLPLRVRTFLTADGSAVLVAPAPVHELAGHDRRLAARGVTVLPTTMALVDASSGELVLPEQADDPLVPSGRVPVRRILLRDAHEPPLDGADVLLGLARLVVRSPGRDLQRALDDVVLLAARGCAELMEPDAIAGAVHQLGS